MRIVTSELLRQLTAQALTAPRLRQNYNLHVGDHAYCHRLLNAIEPASYIRPHRHLDLNKAEGFVLLSGALGVITLSDEGVVMQTALLSFASGNLAADIPPGVFHTAVSLASGTVFYEAKAGPYLPLTEEEKAPWSPEEGSPSASIYLEKLRGVFV